MEKDLVQIVVVKKGDGYSVIGMSEKQTEDRFDNLTDVVAVFTVGEWMHERLREPNSQVGR